MSEHRDPAVPDLLENLRQTFRRDPAVEAAKRAERQSRWWESGNQTAWDVDYAEAAAREALAPIRELHAPEESCDNQSGGIARPAQAAVPANQELNDE